MSMKIDVCGLNSIGTASGDMRVSPNQGTYDMKKYHNFWRPVNFADMLESTRIKSSKNSPYFQGNTSPVPIQAGFDKFLMNQSQPSQFQIFKAQHNRW